jgi:hypothetical protein
MNLGSLVATTPCPRTFLGLGLYASKYYHLGRFWRWGRGIFFYAYLLCFVVVALLYLLLYAVYDGWQLTSPVERSGAVHTILRGWS